MSLVAKYQPLVAAHPGNELFRFSLARALIEEGRHAEAVPHLESCLDKKPDWMVVVMLLAQAALAQGDKAHAKSWYDRALALAIAQQHEDPEKEIRAALEGLK